VTWRRLIGFTRARPALVAEGGADRAASVRNGLALPGEVPIWVLMPRCRRPCVTPACYRRRDPTRWPASAAAPGSALSTDTALGGTKTVPLQQRRTHGAFMPREKTPQRLSTLHNSAPPHSRVQKVSPPMMSNTPAPRVLRFAITPWQAWIT